MTDNASRERANAESANMDRANAKMNDLIRGALGHTIASDGSEDRGEAGPSPTQVGGKSDGGEGGVRFEPPVDMNAELRRATGRPGFVDESGRAWS
jgi:hypothetical protein